MNTFDMLPEDWHTNLATVRALGGWLIDQGVLFDVAGVQEFYDAPQKWHQEMREFLDARLSEAA